MKFIKNPINIENSYSILIPILKLDGQDHLVLEKRSSTITQPNEISFPGGKIELNETPKQAAIRETCEEIGILESEIEIQEMMAPFVTPFNTIIYIYVARLKTSKFKPNEDEVAKLIYLPLNVLDSLKPQIYTSKIELKLPDEFPYHQIPNGKNYPWKNGSYDIYFYEFEDNIIWGITGKILDHYKSESKYKKTGCLL